MLLLKVAQAFDKAKLDYCLVGGMAVVLQGIARGTVDIDLVINLSLNDFQLAEKTLSYLGFQSRLPIDAKMTFQFRQEYIEKRNLIAWSFYNPKSPIDVVDILITENCKKIKTNLISVTGYKIKVASIPDLIRMKSKTGRPQDAEDVKMLKELLKDEK